MCAPLVRVARVCPWFLRNTIGTVHHRQSARDLLLPLLPSFPQCICFRYWNFFFIIPLDIISIIAMVCDSSQDSAYRAIDRKLEETHILQSSWRIAQGVLWFDVLWILERPEEDRCGAGVGSWLEVLRRGWRRGRSAVRHPGKSVFFSLVCSPNSRSLKGKEVAPRMCWRMIW